jgi:hypothetical protein
MVGEVLCRSTTNNRVHRTIPILAADDWMRSINMRFLVVRGLDSKPHIVVSDLFMALPISFREAAIWHEIGHVHYGHHNGNYTKQEQLRTARLAAIQAGRVMQEELEADQFAVVRLGKAAVIAFLGHCLATRPSGASLGRNELGRRELQLRIEFIEAIQAS